MLLLDSSNTVSTPNMQICDICYFPEYAREYEKYYLKLGDVQSPVFGCLYFFKLSVSDKRKRNMYWYLKKLVVGGSLRGAPLILFNNFIRRGVQCNAVFSLRYIICLCVFYVTLSEKSSSLYLYIELNFANENIFIWFCWD